MSDDVEKSEEEFSEPKPEPAPAPAPAPAPVPTEGRVTHVGKTQEEQEAEAANEPVVEEDVEDEDE